MAASRRVPGYASGAAVAVPRWWQPPPTQEELLYEDRGVQVCAKVLALGATPPWDLLETDDDARLDVIEYAADTALALRREQLLELLFGDTDVLDAAAAVIAARIPLLRLS